MSEIKITTPVTRGDKKRLLMFPWELYKNDPYWIPPLRSEEKGLLGFGKDPFYERNRVQTFMASRDGKTVGRIAAILNVGHIERYNDGVGFGFESVDDKASPTLFCCNFSVVERAGMHKGSRTNESFHEPYGWTPY